ncbi:MAG: hypothetical protein JWR80_8160 [Bradyrhizobium sp.]|nr:hypothetical protein [Bradyrhizobium sp.]
MDNMVSTTRVMVHGIESRRGPWCCMTAVGLCLLALQSSPARAQAAPETAVDDGSAIRDIVVTARRRAERAQATPISITAVSGDELKARSVATAADLQQIVPGLSMTQNVSDAFSVNWQLRAQSATDANSINDAPVSVYSDGVFLNSLAGVLSASVVDLERVEVLKGPQGTLYGRNTTGGGVNFYTHQPVDRWEGQMTAGAGSYNAYEASGVLNAPLGGGNAIRLVGEVTGNRGYGLNVTTNTRTGDQKSAMVRGAIRLVPSASVTVTLRGDYSKLTSDGGPVSIPLYIAPGSLAARNIGIQLGISATDAVTYYNSYLNLQGSGFRAAYNASNFAAVETYGTSGTVEADLGFARLKSITAYRHAVTNRATDTDAIPVDVFYLNSFQTRISQFTEEAQLAGDILSNRLHYTLGGFYLHFQGNDLNASTVVPALSATQPTRTDGRVTTESLAFFGQAIFDITPTIHFTGGLRYTKEKKRLVSRNNIGPAFTCNVPAPAGIGGAPCEGTFRVSEHNLSYTAGLDWNVTSAILLYAKTSRGYKSGGVNEKLTSNPASVAPYRPEQLTDYEAGFKSDLLGRRLRINATYYHSVYTDAQRSVFTVVPPFNAISVVQNAATAIIDGVEVEATAAPTSALRIQGSLSYTLPKYSRFVDPVTGQDFSSQKFNQVSKWTYSLSGAYTLPTSFGSTRLQLDWAYKSGRNLFPTGGTPAVDNQPGYGLLNGQVQFTLAKAGVDARFFIKNMLNKYYIQSVFDVTPSIGVVTGYPGTPRTWGVSVTKKF